MFGQKGELVGALGAAPPTAHTLLEDTAFTPRRCYRLSLDWGWTTGSIVVIPMYYERGTVAVRPYGPDIVGNYSRYRVKFIVM